MIDTIYASIDNCPSLHLPEKILGPVRQILECLVLLRDLEVPSRTPDRDLAFRLRLTEKLASERLKLANAVSSTRLELLPRMIEEYAQGQPLQEAQSWLGNKYDCFADGTPPVDAFTWGELLDVGFLPDREKNTPYVCSLPKPFWTVESCLVDILVHLICLQHADALSRNKFKDLTRRIRTALDRSLKKLGAEEEHECAAYLAAGGCDNSVKKVLKREYKYTRKPSDRFSLEELRDKKFFPAKIVGPEVVHATW